MSNQNSVEKKWEEVPHAKIECLRRGWRITRRFYTLCNWCEITSEKPPLAKCECGTLLDEDDIQMWLGQEGKVMRPVPNNPEEPMSPGEGWFWVKPGDTMREGDEFVGSSSQTYPVTDGNVGKIVGPRETPIRRKLPTSQPIEEGPVQTWAERHAKELVVGKWYTVPSIDGHWKFTGRHAPCVDGDLRAWFADECGKETYWFAAEDKPFILCDPQPESAPPQQEEYVSDEFEAILGLKPQDLRVGDALGEWEIYYIKGDRLHFRKGRNCKSQTFDSMLIILDLAPVKRKRQQPVEVPSALRWEVEDTVLANSQRAARIVVCPPNEFIGKHVRVTVEEIHKGNQ